MVVALSVGRRRWLWLTPSLLALLISALVLTGWAFGVTVLTSVVPGWPTMAPETAIAFMFSAASLLLTCTAAEHPAADARADRRVQIARIFAALVAAIGVLRLAEIFVGIEWIRPTGLANERMVAVSAVEFALLGTALMLTGTTRAPRLFEALTLVAGLLGWLGISHYVYRGDPVPHTPMALHTGVLFLMLSIGAFATRRDTDLMQLITSDGAGGKSARWLFPAAVFVPLLVGLVPLYAEYMGWIGSEAALSSFALAGVLLFGGLVWINAAMLERADGRRRQAIRDLETSVQALQQSEARFRRLADDAPVLIWMSGLDKGCTWFNRQWLEFVGRSMERELGNGWAENVHSDDFAQCLEVYSTAFDKREPFTMEYRLRRHDGAWRWLRDHGVPLRSDAGFTGYVGSCIDVTVSHEAEATLRAQLARLALLDRTTHAIGASQDLASTFQVIANSLEEHSPLDFSCLCLHDPLRRSFTVSCVGAKCAPVARLLSLHEDTQIPIDANGLAGSTHGELVHEPDLSRSALPFSQLLASAGLRALVVAPLIVEGNVLGALLAARRDAGSFSSGDCEFLRQVSGHVALAVRQGELYGALQRAYDDLRNTQQATMQLERLRAFGQMASGVAHDINNALSPAAIYVHLLLEREPTLSAQGRKLLTLVRQGIDDVANTIARMREFYRPQEHERALAPIELNRVIREVLELTRARWSGMPQEHGVVVEVDTNLAANLPLIAGVENEIRDALTNLVLNAVDAMPDGGTLRLSSRAVRANGAGWRENWPSELAEVEVSDTGIGMDEATRSHCFEPFFTTKGQRGTGLGLATVYGMAQRHGAEIEIDSAVGAGTRIRLTFLPALRGAEPADRAPPALRPAGHFAILIVDDDPLVLNALREMLEGDGHEVAAVDNGKAAIELFGSALARGERFAAVITDLGMPYVDGRKVASAIKAASIDTPVILLTGWGRGLLADDEVPPGVDRVLSKPPKLVQLRHVLAELVEVPMAVR